MQEDDIFNGIDRESILKILNGLFVHLTLLYFIRNEYKKLAKGYPDRDLPQEKYLGDLQTITTTLLKASDDIAALSRHVKESGLDEKLKRSTYFKNALASYKPSKIPVEDIEYLMKIGFSAHEIRDMVTLPEGILSEFQKELENGLSRILDDATYVLANMPAVLTSNFTALLMAGIFGDDGKEDEGKKGKNKKKILEKIADNLADGLSTGGGSIAVGANIVGLAPSFGLTIGSLLAGSAAVYKGAKGFWRRLRPRKCKNNHKVAEGFDKCPFCLEDM